MPHPITDPRALRLLRSMIYGDLSILTPKVDQDIYYPKAGEVSRINREEMTEFLSKLWKQGYLKRKFYGKVFRCPHDGVTNLRPRLLCPRCQSEKWERQVLIEHLDCGHIDIERNFQRGEEYVCPKDGKKLRQIGVDYRKPGTAYYCPACEEIHPTLLERWTCNISDHTFPLEEAVAESVYSYTLNEEKRGEILSIFEFIEPIADVFKRFGFKTEAFYSIKGTSGMSHLVDIYAQKDTKKPITIIAGVLIEKGIKPEEVLKLYSISLDINTTKTFLIAIPNLDKESKVYTEKLGLSVIEAKDFETVGQRLDSMLKE